jgi:hypothetical protein
LLLWARHLLSAEDLRKRADDLQKLRQKKPRRQPKNWPPKATQEASAQSLRRAYGQRSDCASRVLEHACRGDELEWHGHAEYAAAFGFPPQALRIWRDRLEASGNEMDWRSLLHPSARAQLSSAANCAPRKHRFSGGRAVELPSLQRRDVEIRESKDTA